MSTPTPTELMERRLRVPIIVATLLVVPVLILQATDPGQPWNAIAYVGDWLIWLTFLAEVVAMLIVTDDRRRWLRDHVLDVLIVVLTPPVGQTALHALRVLRLLQLLRLLRVLTLLRGVFTFQGVRFVAFLAFATLFAGAEAFAAAEPGNPTFWDSLYWALGAMTTAGSGSVVATTTTSEIVGAVLTLIGISFAAVITGALAERFVQSESTITEDSAESLRQDLLLHEKLDGLLERMERIEALVRQDRPGDA